MTPDEFMCMSWADWQRAAQGFALRKAAYLQGIREIIYYNIRIAGSKIPRPRIFRLLTDPVPKPVEPEETLTPEKLKKIEQRYFGKPFNSRAKKKKH